ncbi:hypothetical protein A9R00_08810 [Oleispira antarctica]|uniref:CdsD C-terminal domain-containing protein n=1 Tax=Oleispira antarctica TaxID=188908 RepID=A0A1Y5HVU2_OLEAN|nr:hypothetical protein A9R00_08810 [Oleispira antarctica]
MCSGVLVLGSSTNADQDPMRPPSWVKQKSMSSVKSKGIKLQQILISKDRKIVIINNQILTEGQSIAGMKITKIESAQVMFRRAGVNKVIKLLPASKEVKREI